MMGFKMTDDLDDDVADKVKNFSELLEQLDSVKDKKKRLWREIYENAVVDRVNAYKMYRALHGIVTTKPTEHAVHDKSISSYLERMAKSNDQLIKLAELLGAADKKSEAINPDDMYDEISRVK